MVNLYDKKRDCCGCAACVNICEEDAISMKPDKDGFTFPKIDGKKCTECGLCEKVCAFQNDPIDTSSRPIKTYAAINKNRNILYNSSSGGVFAALSQFIFERKGVVFGCVYNSNMHPEHISADNRDDMRKMQGSKYVQSNINYTYREAKQYLKEGRWVLFTGTPCQIAGLNSFLGKEYDKLITADFICHGVPSAAFFKDYIKYLEGKLKGKITDFSFRDKSKGWGLSGKVSFHRNGKLRIKNINSATSYYYGYFLGRHSYRESCYFCKYACGDRPGDFSMGDYWGIQKFHPEIETGNGISVLLLNSSKGKELAGKLIGYLDLTESSFKNAKVHNTQLRKPPAFSEKREKIFKTWHNEGCEALAAKYYRDNKKRYYLSLIKMIMPEKLKNLIRRVKDMLI